VLPAERTDAGEREAMIMTQSGLIVVGVDGTAASQDALVVAMREAFLRGSTLLVLTTWRYDIYYDTVILHLPLDVERQAHLAQEAAITRAKATLAETPVISRRVIEGEAGHELVRAAEGAELLVVGSARKNVIERAVIGSVSQFCVKHATCPVVVVPQARSARDGLGPPQGTTPAVENPREHVGVQGEAPR
jgi:nucleotide-binding universal stress UspA family protein